MSEGFETVVTGVGLWAPGFPNAEAWLSGAPDPEAAAPTAGILGRRAKRRASPLTRVLAEVFAQAAEQGEVESSEAPAVFGSALGEADTMIGLLDQMWREGGEMSPMKFAGSVHNAASGAVSIATTNRDFTTSLAADYDTPAMALMEGVGLVATRSAPVVVVCGDEAAPADLVPEGERFDMLAAAVVLAPAGSTEGLARLRGLGPAEPTLDGAEVDDTLARNPQIGLFDLVDAALRGRRGMLRLDRGSGRGWCVELR